MTLFSRTNKHTRWISWCSPPHTSTPTGKSLLRRRRQWWRLPPQTAHCLWRVSSLTTPTPKSSTSMDSSRAKTALKVPKMTHFVQASGCFRRWRWKVEVYKREDEGEGRRTWTIRSGPFLFILESCPCRCTC